MMELRVNIERGGRRRSKSLVSSIGSLAASCARELVKRCHLVRPVLGPRGPKA